MDNFHFIKCFLNEQSHQSDRIFVQSFFSLSDKNVWAGLLVVVICYYVRIVFKLGWKRSHTNFTIGTGSWIFCTLLFFPTLLLKIQLGAILLQLIQFVCFSRSVSNRRAFYKFVFSVLLLPDAQFIWSVFHSRLHSLRTVTWCSFFRFYKEPSINSALFLNLWGGAPFVSVMSFVAENKATWILCKIHRGQSRWGCILFMRMYGLSQGLSVLICVFHGKHSGDANWPSLLESILCMSVCIIDAENHVERIGLKDVCRKTSVALIF